MANDDLILSLDENTLLQLGDSTDGTSILNDNASDAQDFVFDEGLVLTLDDDEIETDNLIDDVPYAQHYIEYKESYVVTPILYDEQELRTKDKVLRDNVTVKEIPVTWSFNTYGGNTVVIG